MTMEPRWCSRESKGPRTRLAMIASPLSVAHRGAAVFLMGMRRPLRMVGSIFAAFDCRALPRLIRVRELFRAFRSGICYRGKPLRASGLSGTARPSWAGSLPNSSA